MFKKICSKYVRHPTLSNENKTQQYVFNQKYLLYIVIIHKKTPKIGVFLCIINRITFQSYF